MITAQIIAGYSLGQLAIAIVVIAALAALVYIALRSNFTPSRTPARYPCGVTRARSIRTARRMRQW